MTYLHVLASLKRQGDRADQYALLVRAYFNIPSRHDCSRDKENALRQGAVNRHGDLPFMLAAQEGNAHLLGLLTSRLPDDFIDATNEEGDTALDIAVLNGHVEVIEVLRALGATVTDTALDRARGTDDDGATLAALTAPVRARLVRDSVFGSGAPTLDALAGYSIGRCRFAEGLRAVSLVTPGVRGNKGGATAFMDTLFRIFSEGVHDGELQNTCTLAGLVAHMVGKNEATGVRQPYPSALVWLLVDKLEQELPAESEDTLSYDVEYAAGRLPPGTEALSAEGGSTPAWRCLAGNPRYLHIYLQHRHLRACMEDAILAQFAGHPDIAGLLRGRAQRRAAGLAEEQAKARAEHRHFVRWDWESTQGDLRRTAATVPLLLSQIRASASAHDYFEFLCFQAAGGMVVT